MNNLENSIKEMSDMMNQLEKRLAEQNEMRQATVVGVFSTGGVMSLNVEVAEGGLIENVGVIGEWQPQVGKSTWIIKFDRQKWIAIGQTRDAGVVISSGWPTTWSASWPTEEFQ